MGWAVFVPDILRRRIDDMWEFIRAHPLHPRIVRRLEDTCFYRIIEIGRLPFNCAFITAMIERWKLEMHTFHLSIGEITITLQDVEILFGLSVDGLPVAYPHALREYTGLHYLEMLQWLIGFRPAEETALSGASRLQLTPVRQHMEAMDAYITGDSPVLLIDRYMIFFMLLMFGRVLFPNTSENLFSLRFLHHLERLANLPRYNWGAVVLGFLHRQMRWASMGTQRDVTRFLPLLQAIRLYLFYQLGLQMQQHTDEEAAF
ncbi:protein MAIN-LIKE 1-like [Nicotiana sylvestris]|uniref:protein MAIN-LIKE 1-like n=1 Tax=Nicotiana sylvestris TaxID=4096 RepID=UPI00388CCAAE